MRTPKTHSAKPDRGISASKRVEAHLRHAIHAGKLRPRQRIIEEDRLLMAIPAYRERMGGKPRFLPRLSGR